MKAGLVGATAIALGASGVVAAGAAKAGTLPLTPSCTDGDDTPSNIEGPFFKPNSPLRTNLVTPGVTGVLLGMTGKVYDIRCRPVAGALIEFWQADRNGRYDNSGYTLRGHQFSAADGTYVLDTVVPKDYRSGSTWRTPHIHVKVQAPRSRMLTTQLFFPDNTQAYGVNFAALNARDGYIDRDCTILLGQLSNNRYPGSFDFVVRTRS
jgi:protocatechuate 3,4-dioxygenase beta subunit